jgi:hypothetical protein
MRAMMVMRMMCEVTREGCCSAPAPFASRAFPRFVRSGRETPVRCQRADPPEPTPASTTNCYHSTARIPCILSFDIDCMCNSSATSILNNSSVKQSRTRSSFAKTSTRASTRPPEASLYHVQEFMKLVMLQSVGNITPSGRFLGRS